MANFISDIEPISNSVISSGQTPPPIPEGGFFSYEDIDEILLYSHLAIDSYAGTAGSVDTAFSATHRPPEGWEVILTSFDGDEFPVLPSIINENGIPERLLDTDV